MIGGTFVGTLEFGDVQEAVAAAEVVDHGGVGVCLLGYFVLLFPCYFFYTLLLATMLKFHFFQNPIFDVLIHSFFAAKFMIFWTLVTFGPRLTFLVLIKTTAAKYFFTFVAL
jgi:hypothetical protein